MVLAGRARSFCSVGVRFYLDKLEGDLAVAGKRPVRV